MDIWVVFTLWLLWIMLIWTFVNKLVDGFSVFLGIRLGVKFLGHIVTLCLTYWGNAEMYHFIFPPVMKENSSFFTSLSTLVPVHLFHYTHPSGCEVASFCGFGLCFLSHWWCWVSFHVLMGHCVYSLEKCLFKSFACFLNWWLICKNFGYQTLSDTWFENIFSYSAGRFYTFLMMSFEVWKF